MFGLRVALGTKKSSNLPTIYQVTYQQIKKKKNIYIYIYLPAIFEKEIKNPNYQNRTSCLNQEIKSSISFTWVLIGQYIYLPAIFEKEIKNPNYQNRTSCLNQEIKSSISDRKSVV